MEEEKAQFNNNYDDGNRGDKSGGAAGSFVGFEQFKPTVAVRQQAVPFSRPSYRDRPNEEVENTNMK